MKCLILCAGYATRLYPLTSVIPKPLLEIGGKPIIEHILDKINDIECIDEIFIVTNNKFFNKFLDWKNRIDNNKIKILNDGTMSEETRLGAIGDIDFAVKKKKINDNLLIIAGDNIFEFSLLHLHNFFKEKNTSVVALYDIINKDIAAKKLGVVEIDKAGKVTEFEEKPEFPKTSLISTACYILKKKDLQLLEHCIKEHKKPDNLGDFIKWLAKRKNIYGYVFSERWFDIGTIEHYEKARKEFKQTKQ